jgi:hypothetical protein
MRFSLLPIATNADVMTHSSGLESARFADNERAVRSPSHRRRSHRPDRHALLLRAVLLSVGGLAGLASLVAFCLMIPGGRIVLMCAGGFLAIATLIVLCCLAGRFTATIVNLFRLEYGRADLELTLKRIRHDHPIGRA